MLCLENTSSTSESSGSSTGATKDVQWWELGALKSTTALL